MADSFATPDELSVYSKGSISADDERSQTILDGATKAIRNFCGWNIAPAEDVSVTLDGGGSVLYLPSLQVNGIASVAVNGATVDPSAYQWSRQTGNVRLTTAPSWPDVWGGIEVIFNSGFADVPADLKQIVLQVSAMALSSPTGATREQAGAVAMAWATTAPGVSGGLTLLDRDRANLAAYKLTAEA
jgi:hypothetical protein